LSWIAGSSEAFYWVVESVEPWTPTTADLADTTISAVGYSVPHQQNHQDDGLRVS